MLLMELVFCTSARGPSGLYNGKCVWLVFKRPLVQIIPGSSRFFSLDLFLARSATTTHFLLV